MHDRRGIRCRASVSTWLADGAVHSISYEELKQTKTVVARDAVHTA